MTTATGRLARLAEFAHDRRKLVLGAWIAALVLVTVVGMAAKGTFKADYSTPGSQSRAAALPELVDSGLAGPRAAAAGARGGRGGALRGHRVSV